MNGVRELLLSGQDQKSELPDLNEAARRRTFVCVKVITKSRYAGIRSLKTGGQNEPDDIECAAASRS
jgi:hypothetical protein